MKRINNHGFAHAAGLAIVIVLTGVVGTYFLVGSRADSCVRNSSGVILSGPEGCYASSPVTPVQPPAKKITRASCTISSIPATSKSGSVLSPTVEITNTGNQVFSTAFTSTILPQDKSGNRIDGKINVKNMQVTLAPGKSTKQALQSYKVLPAKGNIARVFYNVYNANPSLHCYTTSFKLPS